MLNLKTQAHIKSVQTNREKAGEDQGDVGLSLSLKCHIDAEQASWLLGGGTKKDTADIARFAFANHSARFLALSALKLNAELKESVDGKIDRFTIGSATMKKVVLSPTAHDLFECDFMLYVYRAPDDLIQWAIHHERENADIHIVQTEDIQFPKPGADKNKDIFADGDGGEQETD